MIFSKYNFIDKNDINIIEINTIKFMLKTGKIKIYNNEYNKYSFAMSCYSNMIYCKRKIFGNYYTFYDCKYLAPLIKNYNTSNSFCQYCPLHQKEICFKLRNLDTLIQYNIIKNYIPEEIL